MKIETRKETKIIGATIELDEKEFEVLKRMMGWLSCSGYRSWIGGSDFSDEERNVIDQIYKHD